LPKQDKEHLKRELKDAKHQFLQEKAQKKKALEQDIENLTTQSREEQHPLQELENATRQLLHQRTQEKALFHYELQNMTRHLHHEQLRKKAEMHEELKNQSMHLKQEMRYLRKKLKNESREYHRERAQEKELVRQKLENQSEGFQHKKELLQEELEYLKWHARYGRERADEEKRLREELQKETKQLLQERNHVKMTRSELESLEEEDDNKTFGSNSSTTNGRQVNAAAGFSTSMGVLERLSVLVASMLGWATVAIIIITDGRGLSRRFCTTSSGDGAEPLLALEARP
jgi:chromosome segregation ATPase